MYNGKDYIMNNYKLTVKCSVNKLIRKLSVEFEDKLKKIYCL